MHMTALITVKLVIKLLTSVSSFLSCRNYIIMRKYKVVLTRRSTPTWSLWGHSHAHIIIYARVDPKLPGSFLNTQYYRTAVISSFQFLLLIKFLSRNCNRNNLRRPKIQNFPGGACPQTPLAVCFTRHYENLYHCGKGREPCNPSF